MDAIFVLEGPGELVYLRLIVVLSNASVGDVWDNVMGIAGGVRNAATHCTTADNRVGS